MCDVCLSILIFFSKGKQKQKTVASLGMITKSSNLGPDQQDQCNPVHLKINVTRVQGKTKY